MKKGILIGLIGIITISFVGCGSLDKVDKGNGNDTTIQKPSEEKPGEEKPNEEKPSQEKPSEEKPDKTERIFKLKTKDINYTEVSSGEIKTVGLSVADNIKKILKEVSKKYFNEKPLELTTIEHTGDKKIAVINLSGDEKYWVDRMQGSLGGEITQYTLVENILQREYKGYWIDGVRFTLNGKNVKDTGHVPALSQTNYR